MPRIAGIVGRGHSSENRNRIRVMTDCMVHESFHDSGTYEFGLTGVSFGWVISSGTFSDCMPVWNEARDVCLIFSGEHFSSRSELGRLGSKGHEFSAENASGLVHFYEDLGLSAFKLLNGVFAGVIFDLRENKVILFNDRYGLGRIYYYQNEHGFYFASEAKSLLKVIPELREFDMRSLSEFFACGCALQNRTLFKRISLLPGGSAWTVFPDGSINKRSYFSRESWENQEQLSAQDYESKLRETFASVLPRYLDQSSRIGMSLTGGLDGRMIMAWSQRGPGELPCYTFNGPYRDCADVHIARKVADVCGQPHSTILAGDELLSTFPSLAERAVYISDGAMDVTGAVELYVNREARKIAPIRLTGNYGSEILRGHVAFRPSYRSDYLDNGLNVMLQEVPETYKSESAGSDVSFIAFKQVPWHHYARLSVEQSQLSVRSPFLDNDLVGLVYRAPSEARKAMEPSLRLIVSGNAELGRIPTDRGVTYPANREAVRGKLWWAEFLAKAEYAYDYGMPQWLAKTDRVLSPLHLERLFLGKQKFYHFRVWYRHALSNYVKEVLLDHRTLSRPYLNRKKVQHMVEAHVNGWGNYTVAIHKLLTSEIIQRKLIEQR